jgi:hypothetical protein
LPLDLVVGNALMLLHRGAFATTVDLPVTRD